MPDLQPTAGHPSHFVLRIGLLQRSLILRDERHTLRVLSEEAELFKEHIVSTPSVSDPVWQRLVTGQVECQFESLAVKIFLGSAKLQASRDKSPDLLRRLATELQGIFVKNESLQSVQNDLAKFRR